MDIKKVNVNEMNETKTSTKLLMVALVLILATGMFMAGYYYGRASVVCKHDSNRCYQQTDEATTDDSLETEEESGVENEVASESVRDVDYNQLLEDLGYVSDLDQEIDEKEYVDLTGNGEEEVVFSIYGGGTAGNVAVYVYGYQNEKLKQLLEEDSYVKYRFQVDSNSQLTITAVNSSSSINRDKPNSDMVADYSKTYSWQNSEFQEI